MEVERCATPSSINPAEIYEKFGLLRNTHGAGEWFLGYRGPCPLSRESKVGKWREGEIQEGEGGEKGEGGEGGEGEEEGGGGKGKKQKIDLEMSAMKANQRKRAARTEWHKTSPKKRIRILDPL